MRIKSKCKDGTVRYFVQHRDHVRRYDLLAIGRYQQDWHVRLWMGATGRGWGAEQHRAHVAAYNEHWFKTFAVPLIPPGELMNGPSRTAS